MCSIAGKFGMTAETLRIWVRRAAVEDGVVSASRWLIVEGAASESHAEFP